ncbi:MAG: hypothetical protein ACYTA5_25650, partial [Planctomycetota bacterium]
MSTESGIDHMYRNHSILVGLFIAALSASATAQPTGMDDIPTRASINIVFESSNLPIIKIQTNGLDIPNDPRITAEMGVINNGPGMRNHIDDPATDFEGRISIEKRGASTRKFPKKSYALETQDADGNN